MAAFANLSREDRLGLGVAVAAHVALAAVFVLQDGSGPEFEMPERMVVSLADEVSLESTAPDPSSEPAAAFAPELAEQPAPPIPDLVPQPEAEARPAPPPEPRPRATPRPSPTPSPRPTATSRPSPTPTPAPQLTRAERSGGSRIGADFLEGSSDADGDSGSPAAEFGQREQAALASAITRQLKPHWSAPSGVDADRLVTILSWELNRDGSLKGRPKVVGQSGINDSNRPQADLHAERAIRAVQLAAPFNLPDQFYDRWKRVREWRFDRRL